MSAKGIKVQPFPKYWTKWTKITEEMSEEEKQQAEFNNSLLIEKRPKFMRHLYPAYNSQYKEYESGLKAYVKHKFGILADDIEELQKNQEVYDKVARRIKRKNPLIETNGVMNTLCDVMENSFNETKTKLKLEKQEDVFNLYFSKDMKIDNEKLKQMNELFKSYNKFKKNLEAIEEYGNIQKYTKYLREQADWISFDDDELCDLAVYVCYVLNKSKSKDFCWDMYGNIILRHISEKENKKCATMLVKSKSGKIHYLEKSYELREVDVNDYL